jgi:hypothetical protein
MDALAGTAEAGMPLSAAAWPVALFNGKED